jgi:hypothetical protein
MTTESAQTYDTGRPRTDAEKNYVTNGEYYRTHQATQKQIDFVTRLLAQIAEFGETEKRQARDLYQGYRDLADEGKFTMAFASQAIDHLKGAIADLTKSAKATIQWPEVPTGRYAYRKSENSEDIAFFHVVVKDDGFPLLWIYTPLEEIPVRSFKQKRTILQKIADLGTFECELLFGQKIGICSRCGTELTAKESRDYGMGPVCRNK